MKRMSAQALGPPGKAFPQQIALHNPALEDRGGGDDQLWWKPMERSDAAIRRTGAITP